MASENIGNLYPTKIPGYDDAADIQAALRLYHYGSTTYDINNTDVAQLANPSLAYTLNNLQDQITDNLNNPAAAAEVQNTEPVSPVDGFLWVDTSTSVTTTGTTAVCKYQNTQPTTDLVDGLIWIKKGASPAELYVYNGTTSAFVRIV